VSTLCEKASTYGIVFRSEPGRTIPAAVIRQINLWAFLANPLVLDLAISDSNGLSTFSFFFLTANTCLFFVFCPSFTIFSWIYLAKTSVDLWFEANHTIVLRWKIEKQKQKYYRKHDICVIKTFENDILLNVAFCSLIFCFVVQCSASLLGFVKCIYRILCFLFDCLLLSIQCSKYCFLK